MWTIVLSLALITNHPDNWTLDRYQGLSKEYEAKNLRFQQALAMAKHDNIKSMEAYRLAPDNAAYASRFFALANEDPAGPAALDALFDTVRLQPVRITPMGREALTRLQQNLASPKMAIYVEELEDRTWPEIESFLREVLEHSPDRSARGSACQGLANLLALWAVYPKQINDPGLAKRLKDYYEPDHLAAILRRDTTALLAEATALHERVVAEFPDVRLFPAYPQDERTLGPVSRGWLDSQQTTAIGREAPNIEGFDLDGKPLRLADYRGKVVVLVFSASWCGPCMEQVPNEKALAARFQGRPFALLGVNCDHKVTDARAMTTREGITWPQWFDGDLAAQNSTDGPIREQYVILGIPAIFVLDENGFIRDRDVRGKTLHDAVERLLDRPTISPARTSITK